MRITSPLLVVCGPTASGKTWLSVELAKRYGGEVVSADSMQIYRGMDIGTAKPTAQEMDGVPHHLIDFLPPEESFSVARYALLAREIIADIHARGKLPILAGGTGLYIKAVTEHIQYGEMPEDQNLRERLRNEAALLGGEAMLERLRAVDPVLAETFHPNDLGRVLRALEVHALTGEPLSEWQRRSRETPPEYGILMLGLSFRERGVLYARIDSRVDEMLRAGLLEEARALYEGGFAGTASQAIGYKELFDYLRGEQKLEAAVERLKMQTRRYAKRQLTWFRRGERVRWLYVDDYADRDDLLRAACMLADQEGMGEAVSDGKAW